MTPCCEAVWQEQRAPAEKESKNLVSLAQNPSVSGHEPFRISKARQSPSDTPDLFVVGRLLGFE
jgi:hypothetical protein